MKLKTHLLLGTVLVGTLAGVAPASWASSHREAPAIAGMPRVDATDFYMFRSYETGREGYVTLIANYLPDQSPYGGPNYYKLDNDAIYEIHIDNDGDAKENLTFQFNFDSALANGGTGTTLDIGGVKQPIPLRQSDRITALGDENINETESYTIRMITNDRRKGIKADVMNASATPPTTQFVKPIDNIGNKTLPVYEAYANAHIYPITIPNCPLPGKVFVGQREEAFAVNLGEIFDLVNLVPIQGETAADTDYFTATPFPGGIVQDEANNDLDDKNVTSIALELPTECLVGEGNKVIGGWTTASLPQAQLRDPSPTYNGTTRQGGAMVQVSRLSAPLVNEVVIGLKDKDLFNAARPTQDGALATYVTHPTLPALLDLLFRDAVGSPTNIAPTNFPRNDLVAAFLTGFAGVNQLANVSPSEMMRLNTGLPVTAQADQHTFGLVAEDLAGCPNGRRPGDDVVDIALRVVMGALCHPLPLGAELGFEGAVEGADSDSVNIGLCTPEDAPVGNQPFTDGAPLRATELQNAFPYLNTPIPGSPNDEG